MIQKLYKKLFVTRVTFSFLKTLLLRVFVLQNIRSNFYAGRRTMIMKARSATIFIDGELCVDAKNDGQFWFYSSIRLLDNAAVSIKGKVNFFSGLQLKLFENARLSIGDRTYFSGPIVIHSKENISIGSDCSISWFCTIIDSNFHEIDTDSGILTKEVLIGNNVWIGNNVTILPGTIIEDNVIIGAQSMVKGHYYSNGIYAGNPARLIRQRT